MSALLDVPQVAERLGMSTTWVRQRVKADEIPYVQLGGRIKFRPEDIEDYINGNLKTT